MPVVFSRGGDIFEVYQGNGTFRVHHKGADILDFRVADDQAPVAPQIGAVAFNDGVATVSGVTLPGLFSAIVSFSSAPIGGLAIANLAKSGNAPAHVQLDLQRGDNTIQIDTTGLETEPVLWLHTTVLANALYATDQPVQIK